MVNNIYDISILKKELFISLLQVQSDSYKTFKLITQEDFDKIAPKPPKKLNQGMPPPPPRSQEVSLLYTTQLIIVLTLQLEKNCWDLCVYVYSRLE